MKRLGASKAYLRRWSAARDVERDGGWGSCVHADISGPCGRLSLESGGQHNRDWGRVDRGENGYIMQVMVKVVYWNFL